MAARKIRVIDSHTGGEPTRLIIDGAPDLGHGSAAERLTRLRSHHDDFRSAVVNEPRGYGAMVGALLGEPSAVDCVAQVIFFNNVGYLGMCVHGTIGVAITLASIGKLAPGAHRFETPAGIVGVELRSDGQVAVENVVSYRTASGVEVPVAAIGSVRGDVAWGGNWFYLVEGHGQRLEPDNVAVLTDYCWSIRQALQAARVVGDDGAAVDHIELFGPPTSEAADSRNFVLCPGREYDRSPCGTGTSAKMACLWADGKLLPGQPWRQESILGSRFDGSIEETDGGVLPTIVGSAWVTSESTLFIDDEDPFGAGIRSTAP
ncbi:MAG TPA: proline racemase family protein [Acidobacteriota bacterium]|nr:proline racemase family protein [Acidobacteriota bacterium]